MATYIPADVAQPTQEVTPKNGKAFTLQELYRYTEGGPVEFLDIGNGQALVCNEESKCVDEPVKNERAMEYVVFPTVGELKKMLAEQPHAFFVGDLPDDDNAPADYIAGDVLLCTWHELR